MAEASTLGVAQDIIGRLSSTTFEEIGSSWGFSDDFGKLKDTISTILDAEQQNMIHQNEDWIMKFKVAVYDADDLLTDFFTEHSRGRVNVMGGQQKIANTCLEIIQCPHLKERCQKEMSEAWLARVPIFRND